MEGHEKKQRDEAEEDNSRGTAHSVTSPAQGRRYTLLKELVVTITKSRRMPLFSLLAVGVLVTEWIVVHSLAVVRTSLLPLAVLADLVFVLPTVFYFLVLRPAKRGILEAAPIATTGSLVAAFLLAGRTDAGGLVLWTGILAELAVLALLVQKLRGATRQFKESGNTDDLLLRLESIPERWLRIVGLELVVFYYALWGPRIRPTRANNAFSYTEKSGLGGLLFALGFITVVEGLVVHFLLHQWRPVAGWVFTGLHAYTLLWLSAAYQAARLRPVVVFEDRLLLRLSLLWTAEIPRAKLLSVTAIKAMPEDKTILRVAFGDEPRLLLTFSEPISVKGLLGRQKQVRQIALSVDAPEALRTALG